MLKAGITQIVLSVIQKTYMTLARHLLFFPSSLPPSLPSFLCLFLPPLSPHPYLLVYDTVKLDIYFCCTIQTFSDLKNRT